VALLESEYLAEHIAGERAVIVGLAASAYSATFDNGALARLVRIPGGCMAVFEVWVWPWCF
jgi:hypothetical protein